jgi:hypothetical protein
MFLKATNPLTSAYRYEIHFCINRLCYPYLHYIFLHNYLFLPCLITNLPVRVAAWCKALVCDLSLAGIASSNPAGGIDFCLLCVLSVVR